MDGNIILLVAHELNCDDCKPHVREGICFSDCKNGSKWEPDYEGAQKYVPSEYDHVDALLPLDYVKISNTFEIKGHFDDQRGIVERQNIVGYNNNGVPCRRYKWINPKLPELKSKFFEAYDDQIEFAKNRV
jgi:hypothetical protein